MGLSINGEIRGIRFRDLGTWSRLVALASSHFSLLHGCPTYMRLSKLVPRVGLWSQFSKSCLLYAFFVDRASLLLDS